MKEFYADEFYRNENGTVYTGEYIKLNPFLKKHYTLTKIENPFNELRGQKVRCVYSQIFYPDSNMILCNNNIPLVDEDFLDNLENGRFWGYYDENGDECDEENAVGQYETEVFQWFIIDDNTAKRLMRSTKELVRYSEKLNVYVLGVTHYGRAWDDVTTEFIF